MLSTLPDHALDDDDYENDSGLNSGASVSVMPSGILRTCQTRTKLPEKGAREHA